MWDAAEGEEGEEEAGEEGEENEEEEAEEEQEDGNSGPKRRKRQLAGKKHWKPKQQRQEQLLRDRKQLEVSSQCAGLWLRAKPCT